MLFLYDFCPVCLAVDLDTLYQHINVVIRKLSDLDYSFGALEPHIDARTMEIHHDKHHAGYVANLNKALKGLDEFENLSVEDLLPNVKKVLSNVRQAVVNNVGGHANHSLFLENNESEWWR